MGDRDFMATESLHAIVMAGGSGTRFWPRSRKNKPKQLLALWDDKTLLAHTLERCRKVPSLEKVWIVTAERLVDASRAALNGSDVECVQFLGEPIARNTAACILWGTLEAARYVEKSRGEATVVVMPADSYVGREDQFTHAIEEAVKVSRRENAFVTLGINPTHAETGYGYIKKGKTIAQTSSAVWVDRFVEKPDQSTAEVYFSSREYLWNAGMFVFPASIGLKAFKELMPSLWEVFHNNPAKEAYKLVLPGDAISFDYGIMERATEFGFKVAVVPVSCDWSDVGSFSALEEIGRSQRGDVVSLESEKNIVQTDTGVVALLGVRDLIVVRDGDVVLVAPKSRAQDVKKLLDKTKERFPDLE